MHPSFGYLLLRPLPGRLLVCLLVYLLVLVLKCTASAFVVRAAQRGLVHRAVACRPWRRNTAFTTSRHHIGRCVSSYTAPELVRIYGHAGDNVVTGVTPLSPA